MDRTEVLAWLQWLWDALTSPTSTWLQTLVTGAIGAVAGSIATQRLVSRHDRLNLARAELSAVNHAMNLCFVTVNHCLAHKRQSVLPMVKAFEALDGNTRRALVSRIRGEIAFDADLVVLPNVHLPVDHLERIVLERISMRGRGLAAVVQITTAARALQTSIELRAALISEIRERRMDGKQLSEMYLGLETERGADTRFKDNVRAIALYTDDCIFFAHLAVQDLREHALAMLRAHGRALGSERRDLPKFNFNEVGEQLMPDDEDYRSWLSGFKKPIPWWNLRARLKR